jgi:hypothetical protein
VSGADRGWTTAAAFIVDSYEANVIAFSSSRIIF